MAALDFPDSPSNGDEFSGYVYDSAKGVWNRLPTLPALDLVAFSATAPSSPQDGQFWFDTTSSKMYVYYNDGSSAQWVSTLGGLAGQTGEEGQILVHNGTEWLPSDGISHNAIINGDFGIWQRGTTFSGAGYTADRFYVHDSGATIAATRETFSPNDITAVGYGSAKYFCRIVASAADDNWGLWQNIEDVETFSNQVVTASFWAKSSDVSELRPAFVQYFGSGGSSTVITYTSIVSLSSSWARYSVTATIPSVSGKTIVAGSLLRLQILNPNNEVGTFDIWGVQLEAGSVATPFRLAGGGSKAAELALCHRYYQTIEHIQIFAMAAPYADSNGIHTTSWQFPYGKMRAVPSLLYQDELGNSERFSIQRNNQNNFAQDNINLRPFGGAVTTELVRTFSLYNETSGFSSTGDFGLAKALNVRLDAEL